VPTSRTPLQTSRNKRSVAENQNPPPYAPLKRAGSFKEAIISRALARLPAIPNEDTLNGAFSFNIGLIIKTQTIKIKTVDAGNGRNTGGRLSVGMRSKGCCIIIAPYKLCSI
jgi:hypothetical protein